MISDPSLVANCYPRPWVSGLVGGVFVALGLLLIRHRKSVARALVSGYLLSWWRPSPDEREPTVILYSKVVSVMLAFFGGSMVVLSVLGFAGSLCHS